MQNKKIWIVGGGTVEHVRNHLALAAVAYGQTVNKLVYLTHQSGIKDRMDVEIRRSKMTGDLGQEFGFETSTDLMALAKEIKADPLSKIIFWTPAVCDFAPDTLVWPNPTKEDEELMVGEPFGKHAPRLSSDKRYALILKPTPKIVNIFRANGQEEPGRKDLFLVSFKTTTGATSQEQYLAGLDLLKRTSSNLVLANDVVTRNNMVICPEEAVYHETTDRDAALRGLVEMTLLRSNLTFTQSTVIAGEPIPWTSDLIPASLKKAVDYCIDRGAYKKFRGVTAGHFAVKLSDTEFLTSIRKTDFNDMKNVGLVKVKTDGPDTVLAYGAKPSVGGQSQRIVFHDHPGYDCIVHFHCPIREGSKVPVASQREVECGSHQCGANTSNHLKQFGNLWAVYLEQHGPNILFNKDIDPNEVIAFIEENFDLELKTGGYQLK